MRPTASARAKAGYETVTGQFAIGTKLCAEPRVDPLLTVTYAYLEKGVSRRRSPGRSTSAARKAARPTRSRAARGLNPKPPSSRTRRSKKKRKKRRTRSGAQGAATERSAADAAPRQARRGRGPGSARRRASAASSRPAREGRRRLRLGCEPSRKAASARPRSPPPRHPPRAGVRGCRSLRLSAALLRGLRGEERACEHLGLRREARRRQPPSPRPRAPKLSPRRSAASRRGSTARRRPGATSARPSTA